MRTILSLMVLAVLSTANAYGKKDAKSIKPNVIYILADDLGYGDLSCYGQEKFKTPNLDALATRGMLFSDHYCGSAVCAPSRSSLMTGEHTGHTPIRGNRELKDREGQEPMPRESYTLAELFKDAGYVTGAFGKWGLGYIGSEGDANAQGFDLFYGYNCQRMAHRYYPTHLWRNDQKELLKGNDWVHKETYAPDLIQEETLKFIEQNSDKPFFAYVPCTLPHAELLSPEDSLFTMFEGKFEEVPHLETDRYTSSYGPDCVPQEYSAQATPFAAFASMVTRLDLYVGQIVDKLEELGIADNTIIMFASDNGPHTECGASPEYFNSAGGFRGVKRDLYEGGVRSPFIVVWPGVVAEGSTSGHVSSFWDMLPTFSDIVDVKLRSETDGISMLPTLTGEGKQKQHDYLYWELNVRGGRQAVRMDNWKGVVYGISKDNGDNFELYDLSKDLKETNNVADKHPDIVKKIKAIMERSHIDSEIFPLGK